jgi:hypothetical protein
MTMRQSPLGLLRRAEESRCALPFATASGRFPWLGGIAEQIIELATGNASHLFNDRASPGWNAGFTPFENGLQRD